MSPGVDISDISVFVVEDEFDLREEVVSSLTRNGFAASGFPGSRELYRALMQGSCDVVVLDIGLPGEDGLSIMHHLRATTQVGIVMFTARSRTDDRVQALRAGADAYLTKPVDLDELAATLISVVRRLHAPPASDSGPPSPVNHSAANWRLSPDYWFLIAPNGVQVTLSAAERILLEALFRELAAIVSRESLVLAMGYHPDEVLSNRLDMTVSRLRRKVLEQTGLSLPLRSLRGVGFTMLTSTAAD